MRNTELHLHTDRSLLDGLNTPDEYFKRAKELGMTHLAVTDHGTLAAHRDFQIAAKKHGLKPILGCEMYISATDRFDRRAISKRDDDTSAFNHLTVLAQDQKGWENLNKLSEIAWNEGLYYKPRIDIEILEEYSEGLIVLSGCRGGLISESVMDGANAKAEQWTKEFKRIFDDRFFMEIQGHNEKKLNYGLLGLAEQFKVKPVVTSDCHYALKEDLWIEDALLILSTKPKPAKNFDLSKAENMDMMERLNYLWPDRKMTFQEYEIFLRSAVQHEELLAKQGIGTQAISNTMIVADMIGDYEFYEGLDLLPIPEEDPAEMLERMAWAGLKERGLGDDPAAVDRLRLELDTIHDKGFDSYFIPLFDAVKYAHDNGIRVGPGRGSGAGSLLLYAIKATEVNPLPENLLFFRFINPERNDFPDVDTDFEIHRRGEIKDYLLRKYKNVASIATWGTFGGKQSVKDAGKVLGIPLGETNKAIKGADWLPPLDWWDEWRKTPNGSAYMKKYPDVTKLAKYLYGRTRQQGMHAGGLVISREPIYKYAPIQSAASKDDEGARIPLVAYDMDVCADVGFIKYDLLGVAALTVISDTLEMIKTRHGKDIDLNALTYDDPKVYDSLSKGFTRGVFQCDATPYTNLLMKMGVKNFNELVASNALVRPGAANSTAGAAFQRRRKGEEVITYPHPVMKSFTEETYGVVIYQEQVMLTMTELAGMKMTEADKVRKIIGKKRDVKEFEEYKEKFIKGASDKVPVHIAEGLWHDFEAHAGYSFNKSHAFAYSMLSYWTAWLKEYYPIEYLCALLRNEDDKDKRLDYLMEAKRLGIKMKLPHVNYSVINFEIQTDSGEDFIRFGLSNIKNISGKIGNRLLQARPFKDYQHLSEVALAKYSGIGNRSLVSLNAIGGATFNDNPSTGDERSNFYEFLAIPSFQTSDLPPKIRGQLTPLDEFSETDAFVSMGMVRKIKRGPGWARVEIVDETASAGVFTDEHTTIETGQMYVFLISNNRIERYITFNDLAEGKGGGFQFFLERESFPEVPPGMHVVVSFKSRVTKAGSKMAHVVFSDEDKNLTPALVFPTMFMKAYSQCKEGAVVDVVFNTTKDGATFVDNVL